MTECSVAATCLLAVPGVRLWGSGFEAYRRLCGLMGREQVSQDMQAMGLGSGTAVQGGHDAIEKKA